MKRVLFFCVILFISSTFAYAQNVSVRKHDNFSGIVETLGELVNKSGKNLKNTFYISDVKNEEGREFAYAHWIQDKSIIILHLPLEKESADYYWLYSKARIDLLTDVVPTKEDIGGSSFLVDGPWVNSILQRCSRGYKLSVLKQKD